MTGWGPDPGNSGTSGAGHESMRARLSLPEGLVLPAGRGTRQLERVGQGDELRLAPAWTGHRDANRQPTHQASGHRDRWITRDRSRARGAPAVIVAEYVVGQPGGVPRQR